MLSEHAVVWNASYWGVRSDPTCWMKSRVGIRARPVVAEGKHEIKIKKLRLGILVGIVV
jgi:hypothetical protein